MYFFFFIICNNIWKVSVAVTFGNSVTKQLNCIGVSMYGFWPFLPTAVCSVTKLSSESKFREHTDELVILLVWIIFVISCTVKVLTVATWWGIERTVQWCINSGIEWALEQYWNRTLRETKLSCVYLQSMACVMLNVLYILTICKLIHLIYPCLCYHIFWQACTTQSPWSQCPGTY